LQNGDSIISARFVEPNVQSDEPRKIQLTRTLTKSAIQNKVSIV